MTHRFAIIAFALASANPSLAQVPPEKAEATFTVHNPDLEWKLWASEPLFSNPTCIDIDHLGRVWVCEAVNYRCTLHKKPPNRPEGDRILILEDGKGIGKADKVTVFAQAPYIQAPLGIAVAKDPTGPGWKVYVCQSPDILVFEDKDGDGKADGPPKKLLTGFRGVDHDHGVHGISIGPDGKFYFSVGDAGVKDLQSSDGKGRKWTTNTTDCQAGTIWRCDLDGTNLELIAHNFRNPYEPCVDSFGNIFTSDNDDDGTQQTRICYVMPGGNYGYWPRGKGESHWHEEQPGVVPKILRTGFGSPTGMCVYEGTLLPKKYWGQPLHTDAGPGHLRCYHTKPKGAGYEVEREDIVTSTDNWFRPSDVCVAPDGSVFVSDWYDPGVGGHGMGDTTRGRIYRLAPKGDRFVVPKPMGSEFPDLLGGLWSPNQAVRQIATARISQMKAGFGALCILGAHAKDQMIHVRVFWQIAKRFSHEDPWLRDPLLVMPRLKQDAAIQQAVLRMLRDFAARSPLDLDADDVAAILESEPSTRREILLQLGAAAPEKASNLIWNIAKLYDGQDRLYLAALGIAVGTDPKRREIILADFDKHFPEWNDKVADLVWELRPPSVMPTLPKRLNDPKLSPAQRARIVDILATSNESDAGMSLLKVLRSDAPSEVKIRAADNLRQFLPGKWAGLVKTDEFKSVIEQLLASDGTTPIGLQLVAAGKYDRAIESVAKLANKGNVDAIRTLGQLHDVAVAVTLEKLLFATKLKQKQLTYTYGLKIKADYSLCIEVVNALSEHLNAKSDSPAAKQALVELERIVSSHYDPIELKEAAIAGLAGSRAGSLWLLGQHDKKKLPANLLPAAGRLLRNSPHQDLRNRALILFPRPSKLVIASLPSLPVLANRRGDIDNGKRILAASLRGDAQCLKCHTVLGVGGSIGPDLSMIGAKASRENLYESLLYPSKAIADQYAQWTVNTKRGVAISGLKIEESADHVLLRDANGKDHRIAVQDIESKEKSAKSLMPDDNATTLTEDELIDLVEYMTTLKTPAPTFRSWFGFVP